MSEKQSTTPVVLTADQCYRRLLKMVISALCKQAGFDSADQNVLETMTEMLASYIVECGRSSRALADLAGRTNILPIDVTLSLIEMGFNVQNFDSSLLRGDLGGGGGARIIVPGPRPSATPVETKVIHVGKIRPHPPHIPDHMPPFPDPHTYVRTQPQVEFQNDYETAREAAANQQRNMEMSLIKFMLKIEPIIRLHGTDSQLAVLKPQLESRPYLSALIPSEDVIKDTAAASAASAAATANATSGGGIGGGDSSTIGQSLNDSGSIDNPYLRPIKMPRST